MADEQASSGSAERKDRGSGHEGQDGEGMNRGPGLEIMRFCRYIRVEDGA